jgi:hypothetical protein
MYTLALNWRNYWLSDADAICGLYSSIKSKRDLTRVLAPKNADSEIVDRLSTEYEEYHTLFFGQLVYHWYIRHMCNYTVTVRFSLTLTSVAALFFFF